MLSGVSRFFVSFWLIILNVIYRRWVIDRSWHKRNDAAPHESFRSTWSFEGWDVLCHFTTLSVKMIIPRYSGAIHRRIISEPSVIISTVRPMNHSWSNEHFQHSICESNLICSTHHICAQSAWSRCEHWVSTPHCPKRDNSPRMAVNKTPQERHENQKHSVNICRRHRAEDKEFIDVVVRSVTLKIHESDTKLGLRSIIYSQFQYRD